MADDRISHIDLDCLCSGRPVEFRHVLEQFTVVSLQCRGIRPIVTTQGVADETVEDVRESRQRYPSSDAQAVFG